MASNGVGKIQARMAHLLFDTLAGVTVDNQTALTVQSLLDSQSLSNECLSGATVVASRPPTTITLDEEDVFQCGKCKKQYTSFSLFMSHKKEHAVSGEHLAGSPMKQPVQGSLSLSLDGDQQEPDECDGSTYTHTLQGRDVEVGQPIILSDSDILSFSIDHGALNISTGSHVLPSLSHVIQTGTFLTSPGESNSSLKSLSDGTGSNINVTTLEGQPIILTEGSFVTSGGIQQQQQPELGDASGKIVEYGSSTETNLEFLNTTTGTVEFTTQDIVTQQSQQTSGGAEILLSSIVESQESDPLKLDNSTDIQHSTAKTLKLRCKYCSKQFTKNFDLQQHMRSHTGEKPFQCVVCGRAFSQKSNVKKHMATHKVWPQGLNRTLPKEPLQAVAKKDVGAEMYKDSNPTNTEVELMMDRAYVCQYCSTRFESYYELKTHMKSHSHQKVYKCIQKNCQQTFSDLDIFVSHTRAPHPSEVQYRCHVCSKQFNTLADLGIHQYSHNNKPVPAKVGSKFFRCVKCKSKFSSPESLDHHMTISTHSYPCPHCGRVFACERYLRRHLPTHGTAQSFTCQQCGKGFRTEQYLNTHMLTHSTYKPHVCQHCSAAFNRKDKLVRHLLIHQSVKKFKCPFRSYLGCPKEFNRQDKLKLHILTHSSVRPSLQCRICNKTFQRQTQLRQHDRTHHQVAPYSCQNCGKGFKKKVSLAAHECDPSQEHADETEVVTESGLRRTQVQSRLQQVSRRGIRRAKQLRGRSKREIQEEETNSSDNKTGDNVPTIEIIVMPVPVSLEQHSSGEGVTSSGVSGTERGGMYHVVFPSESKMQTVFSTRDETTLNIQHQDQEVSMVSSSL